MIIKNKSRIFLIQAFAAAQLFSATSLENYAAQIRNCTAADGAIYMEPEKNKVEVYFGCTAARGLLNLYAATDDTSHLNSSVRWVDWLVAHQEPEGYWYDYDSGGVKKVTPDSWDSYASLFLTVAHETQQAIGFTTFLTPARQVAMQKAFTCILNLVQSNGLTIAMPSYPAQYTMDNAEVYEGLKAAAADWRLLGMDSLSLKSDSLAQVIQSNIRSRLWIENSQLYRVAIGEGIPDLKIWYPDIIAQLFPLRFGVEPPLAISSVHIMDTLRHLPLWSYSEFNTAYTISSQGFPTDDILHMAHFAKLSGDTAAVTQILRGVDSVSLSWPIDLYAGWRLVLADPPIPSTSSEITRPSVPQLSFSCFPNPISSGAKVNIQSTIPLQSLTLYDLQGRVIQRLFKSDLRNGWILKGNNFRGCYVLYYRATNGSHGTFKLIIQ